MTRSAMVSAILTVLLAAQVVYLGAKEFARRQRTTDRIRIEAERSRTLAAIDTGHLRWIHLQGGDSLSVDTLREKEQHVIFLAFSDRCKWCDSVAPIWRGAVRETPGTVLVYITSTSPLASRAYMDSHGLRGRVLSVDTVRASALERALIARTPWVTILDNSGRRRENFHGSELPRYLGQMK